jgi:transposase-like protein
MSADINVWPLTAPPRVQDPMVTLKCPHCREALYMSTKALEESKWTCPSCKTVTRTQRPEPSSKKLPTMHA